MARPHGSVRIGPISLFTLIIILLLSVLAVLSVTTARAELSITQRQADTTTQTYQLESAGQALVSRVDAELATVRQAGGTFDDASADVLAGVFADYGVVPEVTGTAEGTAAPTDAEALPLGGVSADQAAADEAAAAAQDTAAQDTAAVADVAAQADVADAAAAEGAVAAGDDAAAPQEEAIGEAAGEAITDDGMSVAGADETEVEEVSLAGEGYPDMVSSGTYDNKLLTVTMSLPSGRTLQVGLRIRDDATYTIVKWKVTTQWIDDGTGENLWLG